MSTPLLLWQVDKQPPTRCSRFPPTPPPHSYCFSVRTSKTHCACARLRNRRNSTPPLDLVRRHWACVTIVYILFPFRLENWSRKQLGRLTWREWRWSWEARIQTSYLQMPTVSLQVMFSSFLHCRARCYPARTVTITMHFQIKFRSRNFLFVAFCDTNGEVPSMQVNGKLTETLCLIIWGFLFTESLPFFICCFNFDESDESSLMSFLKVANDKWV